MDKLTLDIVGLSYSQTQTGAYALVLGEQEGKRRLPIIIGSFEAQAIAIEMEKMKPSRPLTHDLFKNFAESFEVKVKEVVIYNLVEGIFYAKLVCQKGDQEVEIDTRTSDAVAIALRFECPIYTFEFILSSAGIILDETSMSETEEIEEEIDLSTIEDTEEDAVVEKSPSEQSVEELEAALEEAINRENYERASKLRDEINKRKEG